MKLYLVLEKSLKSGLKMAQAVHAAFAFQFLFPHIQQYWFLESNNIAVLHVDNLPSLADRLEESGFRIARFEEPDLDNQLTAIGVEPAAGRALSNLQLAS